MLKGIVFDLDGTLVDSLGATFEAFNHGIEAVGGRSHAPEEIMRHFGQGEDQIFLKLVGPEKAQAAYQACCAYLEANAGRVPLHAGIGDLLENVKSAGLSISIVTGRSWATTEFILKHHGLIDRFVTVIADDHVGSPKPSPEGLLMALKRMKLEPSEVVFAGDSWVDIRAAHAAGSSGVAALWDLLVSREQLAQHNPHHWAETPAKLWEICKSLRG